ncbi:MarR family winged helix-turn-helix transcriptional regulator [Dongia deserti]|uniref:MarR family winged helix-turn-helix transcriptional regulator n=1 Tax=Dongia deserti TaxID=2268030 RepID=UPI0013C48DE1|nr:MarR family transcriptional regulator [Dongia deserti]
MAERDQSSDSETQHTANILGALSLLIQDRVERAWQSTLDLSPMAAAAVVQIDNEPGSSIEQVAGRIGLTHSATVRVIDKLAERGLVEKDRARKDARAQSLKLSKPGKGLARQLHAARNQVIDGLLSGLGPVQREALEAAISAILYQCVEPGREADVTCRVCDDRRCTPDICPIRVV